MTYFLTVFEDEKFTVKVLKEFLVHKQTFLIHSLREEGKAAPWTFVVHRPYL